MKPKNPTYRLLTSAVFVCACLSPCAQGAEIIKLQNTNQLDNTASWSGGSVPGLSDVMLWNSTYTTPGATGTLAAIGTNLSVSGIKVTDVGGTRNAATTMVGYQNSGTATLTIGAGGIDLSSANQAFYGGSRVTIGADQTWSVTNANTNGSPAGFNNGEDLCFQAQAAGAPFDFGGRTVTSSGTGNVTLTSGYTLSNGTLNLSNPLFVIQGGTNRLTTLANTLSVGVGTGGFLRLQTNSGALTSASPISVSNGGTLGIQTNNATNVVTQSGNVTLADGATIANGGVSTSSNSSVYSLLSGAVSVSGTVAWNNTGSLRAALDVTGAISGTGATINVQNTSTQAECFTRWNGNNSGFSGTVNVAGASGTRMLRLNNSNSGSANATWNIAAGNTLQVNGVSPQFGVLNGAGTITNSHATSAATINAASGNFSGVISNGTPATNLTKSGTGTLTLSGANTYSGATTVNAGTLLVSSATIGISAVSVADSAAYRVNVATSGDDIQLASLTAGSTIGGTVLGINNGNFANPVFAPIAVAGAFNVNAGTLIDLTGSNLTTGTFPLITYGGTLGGTSGFAGLTLKLPPRVAGNLVDNTGSVDVNITTSEGIRWKGNVTQNWDADTVGDGSVGTANWETTVTNTSTRYIQASIGTDAALFDDQASGTGGVSVNLTTTVSPIAVTVDNTTRSYLLAGPGNIAGICPLRKTGAGNLTLANTTANTYSGLTTIDAGSITLGDGVTSGAGTIGGTIENYGELILNRPDDFTLPNPLTGNGKLTKNQANTATIPNPTLTGELTVNGGKLLFNNGGILSGTVLGTGAVECSAGILTLSGTVEDTRSGDTIVSGTGQVKLQQDPGVNAISGDIYCTGSSTGCIQILLDNQIADTSDLHILGSSTDPLGTFTGTETLDNVFLNTTNGVTGQLILKSNFNVTGTATVTSGILSLGSGSTISIGGIVINSPLNTIVRVAGNTAATTANIGSGGLTAVGGEWQVKYNTSNFDAIVNLGGDVTTTGDFIITNGGYTGVNLNVINLTGARTFNIAAGTTTTVSPDFAGDPNLTADTGDSFTGDLIKAGDGKLVLNALCNLGHTGTTSVNAGTLILNGTAPNSAPAVASGATLGGTGSITASTTLPSGAILSPGNGNAGTLTFGNDLTLAAGSIYAVDITGTSTCDKISTATGTITANGTIAVTLGGHTPVANESFDLADAATITGTPAFNFSAATLPSGLAWDTSTFATTGVITVKPLGYESFVSVITNPADRDPGDDPDGDGVNNLLEYALGGDPTISSQTILPQSSVTGTDLILTFSRRDDSENDTTQQVVISTDLSDWSTVVPITPSGTLPSGVTVNVTENGSSDDTITVTIEKGANTSKFARFKVTK